VAALPVGSATTSDSFKTPALVRPNVPVMTPRFDAIGLVVADMGKALGFYRRLGLEIPDNADSAPHVEVALPGGCRLLFDTVDTIRSFDPDWSPPQGGQRIDLAFACDSPDDVDATYARLTDAGYDGHLPPWNAFWGQRYAVIRDPDGNGVDLFAALPSDGD
jgi:catechol 2,3-dioxygenase-like lactoylglutathione lyase family enzyme